MQPKNYYAESRTSHLKINGSRERGFFFSKGEKVQKGRNVILLPRMMSYLGQPQDARPREKKHHTQTEISNGGASTLLKHMRILQRCHHEERKRRNEAIFI